MRSTPSSARTCGARGRRERRSRRRPATRGRPRSSPPRTARGLDGRRAFSALYLAFLGRPNGPRAGWLLAGLEPAFVVRRLREAGRQRRREARHERRAAAAARRARRHPRGARSTRARTRRSSTARSSVDATRRRLQAESDTLKAERNTASKQVGEAIRGGAAPDGPEVAALKAASHRAPASGSRPSTRSSRRPRRELEDLLLRIPNPADPDVPVGGEEANVTVRTWGELLPHEQPQTGDVGADAGAGTWARKPHWELGRGAGHHRQRPRREDRGLGVPGLQGPGVAAPAGADQLVPRRPHARSTASPRCGRRRS